MPTPLQHKRASALVDKAAKLLKEREPRWEATRRAVGPAMAQLVNTRGAVLPRTNSGFIIFEALQDVGLAKEGPRPGTFVATDVGLGYKPSAEEWQIAMDSLEDVPGHAAPKERHHQIASLVRDEEFVVDGDKFWVVVSEPDGAFTAGWIDGEGRFHRASRKSRAAALKLASTSWSRAQERAGSQPDR